MSRLLVISTLPRATSLPAIHTVASVPVRSYSSRSSTPFGYQKKSPQTFADMKVDLRLVEAISKLYGIKKPTELQKRIIPNILHPRNHLVISDDTGTGKTFSMLLALISVTVSEYKSLLVAPEMDHRKSVRPLDFLEASSLFVVPNRELALQVETWAKEIINEAYPELSAAKFVQCFVSGAPYEAQAIKVMKRHGAPVIAVGTPRRLVEVIGDNDAKLKAEAPSLLRAVETYKEREAEAADMLPLLASVKGLAQKAPVRVDEFTGLRRIFIDEVDNVLKIPGKHATERQRKLRVAKPRFGQILVDAIYKMFGLFDLAKAQQVLRAKKDGKKSDREKVDLKNDPKMKAQMAHRISRSQKDDMKTLGDRFNKAMEDATQGATRDPMPSAMDGGKRERMGWLEEQKFSIVGPRTVQMVVASATASRQLRNWMAMRGWIGRRPVWIDGSGKASNGGSKSDMRVPSSISHYCLIVENEQMVRNLRLKDKSPEMAMERFRQGLEDKAPWVPGSTPWDAGVEARSADQQLSVMEIMAEAAANVIEALKPKGTVVIFTRADASTTKFGHVLEAHEVHARDIMMRFTPPKDMDSEVTSGDILDGDITPPARFREAESGSKEQKQGLKVFLATEEAARGMDIGDAGLVLILDVPKTTGSYLHMAGRTGRFGKQGSVVTVVPVGRLGYYESKMRGIYGSLGVQPLKAPFVED